MKRHSAAKHPQVPEELMGKNPCKRACITDFSALKTGELTLCVPEANAVTACSKLAGSLKQDKQIKPKPCDPVTRLDAVLVDGITCLLKKPDGLEKLETFFPNKGLSLFSTEDVRKIK